MLKLKKVLLIVGLLILVNLLTWGYDPLTDEEIQIYWNSLTLDQKIEEIRKLDLLEHIPPEFDQFKYIALLTINDELIIYPESSIIIAKHVYLEYEIELPIFHIEDFNIPVKKNYILAGIQGGVIAIVGTVVTGEDVWWKYFISGIGGISIGIINEYLFR